MSLGLRGPWIMDDVMLTSLLESGCKHEHMLSPNSSRCKDCSPNASPHLCIFSTVGDRSCCSFCILRPDLSCWADASLEFRPCGWLCPLLTRGVAGDSIVLLLIVTWVLGQKVVLCFGLLGQEDRGIHRDELGPEGPLDYG